MRSVSKIRNTPFDRIALWTGAVCAALCVSLHGQPAQPTIVFEREHIRIHLGAAEIRIEGTYTFANPSSTSLRQGLYYPFPIDSLHPTVENVTVRSGNDTIPFTHTDKGIGLTVFVPENGSTEIKVSYSQTCLDGTGCYILTSTAAWEAPLRHASFEIHVPDTLQLDWAAYDIDKVTKGRASRIHEFSRVNFMPDRDLCLRWRERPNDVMERTIQD
jgi:hypothetical protein